MSFLDPDWLHDKVSLRNLALTQLEREVYNNHQAYLQHLPNSTDNNSIDRTVIDFLWNIIVLL